MHADALDHRATHAHTRGHLSQTEARVELASRTGQHRVQNDATSKRSLAHAVVTIDKTGKARSVVPFGQSFLITIA